MHRDSLRDTILDRAVQLTSVCGLHGLTIGKLATALGISKGGVCAHFPSKDQLQLAVVERASATFAAAAVYPAFESKEGAARLADLTERWFAYLRTEVFEGGCFFSNVLFELDDLDSGPLLEAVRLQYQRYLTYLEEQTATAIQQGELHPEIDPAAFAHQLHGFQLAALTFRSLGKVDRGIELARRNTRDLLGRSLL